METKILIELKKEIKGTLFFFVKMDLKIAGYITQSTVDAFKTQNVEFPDVLKKLVK